MKLPGATVNAHVHVNLSLSERQINKLYVCIDNYFLFWYF
jgi:hypothetical protein